MNEQFRKRLLAKGWAEGDIQDHYDGLKARKPGQSIWTHGGKTYRALDKGVGEKLLAINKSLGINTKPNCACNRIAAEMNRAGIAGCRQNFHTFVGMIKDNAEGFGIADWMTAASRVIRNRPSLLLKINPLDPIPGLFTEAIRMAEEEAKAEAKLAPA